ncbi:hypothetical protein [uncultured Tenacibaculum sp.]|uniref:hypothetical protein n=1 Tax=uncultured Tenacibaculum sp. TaxID=174713 RepID=UPI0026028E2E|nr:hypothetical protein [uncultured Tenacibaculum sp.]
MKLDQIKKFGKELTKKELVNIAGGDVAVGYACNNSSIVGTARGNNMTDEIDKAIYAVCGKAGYRVLSVRPTHPVEISEF